MLVRYALPTGTQTHEGLYLLVHKRLGLPERHTDPCIPARGLLKPTQPRLTDRIAERAAWSGIAKCSALWPGCWRPLFTRHASPGLHGPLRMPANCPVSLAASLRLRVKQLPGKTCRACMRRDHRSRHILDLHTIYSCCLMYHARLFRAFPGSVALLEMVQPPLARCQPGALPKGAPRAAAQR